MSKSVTLQNEIVIPKKKKDKESKGQYLGVYIYRTLSVFALMAQEISGETARRWLHSVAYPGGCTGCLSTPLSFDEVQYSIWLKQG